MLDEHEVLKRYVDIQQNDDIPNKITFAPEGQIPTSVFQNGNAEYLAFLTIFCTQKHPKTQKEKYLFTTALFINMNYDVLIGE